MRDRDEKELFLQWRNGHPRIIAYCNVHARVYAAVIGVVSLISQHRRSISHYLSGKQTADPLKTEQRKSLSNIRKGDNTLGRILHRSRTIKYSRDRDRDHLTKIIARFATKIPIAVNYFFLFRKPFLPARRLECVSLNIQPANPDD